MIESARVQIILSVLDRIRPILQLDGANVELIDAHDNNARIRLTGLCAGCPGTRLNMQTGFEEALRNIVLTASAARR